MLFRSHNWLLVKLEISLMRYINLEKHLPKSLFGDIFALVEIYNFNNSLKISVSNRTKGIKKSSTNRK